MSYGTSILPTQVADWTIINGSMSGSTISLDAGGSANVEITTDNVTTISETIKLTILANSYTVTSKARNRVYIRIVYEYGETSSYMIPIVDTGDGSLDIELNAKESAYTSMFLTIESDLGLTVYDVGLSVISSGDSSAILAAVDGVTEEIPKLLEDYNRYPITIGATEEVIALISCKLTEGTDISSHLQITYVASSSCTITLRLKDNGGTELFAPILYSVDSGKGSLGVPHAYLERLSGIHTFTVTAQCSVGTATFYTRGILYTIDAGHLAIRLIDVGMDVRDIAIQQLPSDNSPSSIYAIGIDDGVARVKYRAYDEDAAVVWSSGFIVAEAKDAAIEFDGNFVRRDQAAYYTLECDEEPSLVFVDMDDNLYYQLGSDETTRHLIDTDASNPAMLRGFRSALLKTEDQGLIIAYIKDGQVYYKNLAYQTDEAEERTWIEPQIVTELGTNVTNVSLHRLNDYRMGFLAENDTGHIWAITDRTYIQSSVPSESLYFDLSRITSSIAMCTADDDFPTVTLTGTTLEDGSGFILESNYPIVYYSDNYYDCFTYVSTTNGEPTIDSVEINDNIISVTFAEKQLSNIMVIEPRAINIRVYADGYGYLSLPSDDITLTFVKKYNYSEALSFNISSINANITQVPIITSYHDVPSESLAFDISNISASITQESISYITIDVENDTDVTSPQETLVFDINNITASITMEYVDSSNI